MSGTIKLEEGSGGDHVGFKAPADIAAEVIWELPATDGTAGQHMATDGAGKLSWASTGGISAGGLVPNAVDHTNAVGGGSPQTLAAGKFHLINMSSAGSDLTFTIADMTVDEQFKALVFGNDTNGYLATFQTTSLQNMYYRGNTDTSVQLVVPDTWIGGAWDVNNSVIDIYDTATFLSGNLAGHWNVDSIAVDNVEIGTNAMASSSSGVSLAASGGFYDFVLPNGYHTGILNVNNYETLNANNRTGTTFAITMRYGFNFSSSILHSGNGTGGAPFSISMPAAHTIRITNNHTQICTSTVSYSGTK